MSQADPEKESESPALPHLTREEILRLPPAERMRWVNAVRIYFPRWQAIFEEIRLCHELSLNGAEPLCSLLVGPIGAGKSTLINSYAQQYPSDFSGRTIRMPIVKATILPKTTIKSMVTQLLKAVGDARPGMGNIGVQTDRLMKYFVDVGAELLILDELQYFLDLDSLKVAKAVNAWVKTVIKESGIGCVLVGVQHEAELVVNADGQLASITADPLVLDPFRWDEANPETSDEFRQLLAEIEARLPLGEPSHLASAELAWRCFVASDGLLRYLMSLIRLAAYLALQRGSERIDQAILAEAFQRRLAGDRRNLPNPFVGDLPAYLPPEERARRAAGSSSRQPRPRE